MVSKQNMISILLRFNLAAITIMLIFLTSVRSSAQEPPPRPITVTWKNQNLSFGAFYQGPAGGTVTISSLGSRSSTGDIVLLGLGYVFSTSLYEIVASPGTVISLLKPVTTISDGNGHSMTLQIDDSNPVSPFVTNAVPPLATQLNIGGTLIISSPAANPPGNYIGTFDITFNQE